MKKWGVPVHDSRALWEKFQLDAFQAGLAWITVLRKRADMREEFDRFDPESSHVGARNACRRRWEIRS